MDGLIPRARETAVKFGDRSPLLGVWCAPAAQMDNGRRTAVVMINAGIIHRVGPNRLYVNLARSLAAVGVSSLRFDMSGIGDSPAATGGHAPLDCALRDIDEAIGWVGATHGIDNVILLGLCSGADLATIRAASGSRVKGIILIDPNIPKTRKSRVIDYRQRLVRLVSKPPTEMVSSLTTLMRRSLPSEGAETAVVRHSEEEMQQFLDGYYRACARACIPTLAVFTGGQPHRYNYREQFLDAFPGIDFGQALVLEYLPDSDHTFTLEAHRTALRELVNRWVLDPATQKQPANLDVAMP